MKILNDTFKNTGDLHHAYLLEGEKEVIREKLLDFVQNTLKHPIQANPDFWHEKFETFSIDDARKLRDMQAMKAMVHERKVFIIEVFSMTAEAQNALLKIFEEPSAGTHFFIIADSADIFLPTLRSRMVVIVDEDRTNSGKKFANEFLTSLKPERLKQVAGIIEEKDKAKASVLIDGLIIELHDEKYKKLPNSASLLKELLQVRGYLSDRSPSIKLLLEHISLILPII